MFKKIVGHCKEGTGVNMKVEAALDDGRGLTGHAILASGRGNFVAYCFLFRWL